MLQLLHRVPTWLSFGEREKVEVRPARACLPASVALGDCRHGEVERRLVGTPR